MADYFKLTDAIINNFISPIAYISDKVPFQIENDTLKACFFTINDDKRIGVSFSSPIETNIKSASINIMDAKRFRSLLKMATELNSSDELIYDQNILKYRSKNFRFKIYLVDDTILSSMTKNINTKKLDSNLSFILKAEDISNLLKIKALQKDKSDKVYFDISGGNVNACITDNQQQNTDEIGIFITDTVVTDNKISSFIIDVDFIKVLSHHKGIDFKLTSTDSYCYAEATVEGVELKYLIGHLVK